MKNDIEKKSLRVCEGIIYTDNIGRTQKIDIVNLTNLSQLCSKGLSYISGFDTSHQFHQFKLLKL